MAVNTSNALPVQGETSPKTALYRRDDVQIFALFLLLLLLYLAFAWLVLADWGYYGTTEQPRFADPWIARSETILSGGVIYRDTFTTTPPLTNLLLIPPSIMSKWFGHQNPGSTLSFMIWFSLFNLLAAYMLYFQGPTRAEGKQAAIWFLLNPLTFSNTVLRRQDESIVVFFIGLAVLFYFHRRYMTAAAAIGLGLLVKLSAGVLMPVMWLHRRDWRFLVVPVVVFGLVFTPFLLAAGESAIFWNPSQSGGQHPFQLKGVSLGSLWNQFHGPEQAVSVTAASVVFLLGFGIVMALVYWRRWGVLEDASLILIGLFLFSPKLHTGYFSILALLLAPLLVRYRLHLPYMLVGLIAVVADIYKWPIINIPVAFWLMMVVYLFLVWIAWKLIKPSHPSNKEGLT